MKKRMLLASRPSEPSSTRVSAFSPSLWIPESSMQQETANLCTRKRLGTPRSGAVTASMPRTSLTLANPRGRPPALSGAKGVSTTLRRAQTTSSGMKLLTTSTSSCGGSTGRLRQRLQKFQNSSATSDASLATRKLLSRTSVSVKHVSGVAVCCPLTTSALR